VSQSGPEASRARKSPKRPYDGLTTIVDDRGLPCTFQIWGCLQEHKPARSPPGHLEAIRRLSVIHGARESMSPALPRRASAVEDFTCLGSGPQGCAAQPQLRLTWIIMDYHSIPFLLHTYYVPVPNTWITVDYQPKVKKVRHERAYERREKAAWIRRTSLTKARHLMISCVFS
jgi:hypothetical protein